MRGEHDVTGIQNKGISGVPVVVQRKRTPLVSMRMQVRSLVLLSGSGIWRCCERWCRLQTWLGSCIAVAVVEAGGCSSDSASSLGTSTCCKCSPKKQTNQPREHFRVVQWVKDPELLQLWHRSQLQLWPGNFHIVWVQPKQKSNRVFQGGIMECG